MTGAEIMAAVGFILLLFGSAFGAWKYVDSKLIAMRSETSVSVSGTNALAHLALDKLNEHKLHVAETYLTKQGMREAIEPVMDAIHGVKSAVDHMGGRIDGIYHTAAAYAAREDELAALPAQHTKPRCPNRQRGFFC